MYHSTLKTRFFQQNILFISVQGQSYKFVKNKIYFKILTVLNDMHIKVPSMPINKKKNENENGPLSESCWIVGSSPRRQLLLAVCPASGCLCVEAGVLGRTSPRIIHVSHLILRVHPRSHPRSHPTSSCS